MARNQVSYEMMEPQRKGKPTSWEDCHFKLEVAHKNLNSNLKRIETDSKIIGSPQDSQDFRQNLNRFFANTTETAKEVQYLLSQLMEFENKSTGFQKTGRRQQREKAAQQVSSSMEELKRLVLLCKDKEKRSPLGFQQASSGLSSSNQVYNSRNPTTNGTEDEKTGLLEANRRSQMQIEGQRQFNEMMIRDREQGIIDIETQVIEINGIFKDMQTLVAQQGLMIDDIESNMSTAEVNVDKGTQELQKANESQSSANTKICYFAIFVVIAALILIIIVLFSSGAV